ncbi:hypothetical protein [uncultured Paraglaciecola sp.]|uniref:hypothetical protein n=1 Tax=uncultured Paraglaciecola sp. TaxID=1765024 RepID=UPI002622F2B2|nr:hypothetical protein [uncultured Paraglaciecola sp.]
MQTSEGDWVESAFKYVDDLTPNSSKPAMWFSRISFGVWQWNDTILPPRGIQQVMATVAHNCGDPELRTTKVGPFSIR